MRAALWMLVAVNFLAAIVAVYVSLGESGSWSAVRDVLQVLAGVSILTAMGLSYLLTRGKSDSSGRR